MICKECSYCKYIANTDTTNQGVCTYPESYFPIDITDECIFTPKSYTCEDCDRFGTDYACATAQADDSIIKHGRECPGWIDKNEITIREALIQWKLRGFNLEEKLADILMEVKKYKIPWENN